MSDFMGERRGRGGGWKSGSLAPAKLQVPALVLARYTEHHAKRHFWVQAAIRRRRALLQGHARDVLHA